jgi:hypothetical protein
MSAPLAYNLDTKLAREGSGSTGGRVDEPGAHIGTIIKAKAITAKSGATGIEIDFETDGKKTANGLQLYTHNKDGQPIFGEKQVHALMTCLKIRGITPRPGTVKEFDYDAKAMVERQATIYPEMMGKKVGIVLQKEIYTKNDGSDGERFNFFCPFAAETNQLAAEVLDQRPAEQLERLVATLRVKDGRRSGVVKGGFTAQTPPVDAYDFDNSDVPF